MNTAAEEVKIDDVIGEEGDVVKTYKGDGKWKQDAKNFAIKALKFVGIAALNAAVGVVVGKAVDGVFNAKNGGMHTVYKSKDVEVISNDPESEITNKVVACVSESEVSNVDVVEEG